MIKYAFYFFLLFNSIVVLAQSESETNNARSALKGLSSILEMAEPEIFGGMYFQNKPEFKVKLLVTDITKKNRLLDYANIKVKGKINKSLLASVLEVEEVEYSFAELKNIQTQYDQALKDKGIRSNSFISVKKNKIIFLILNENQNVKKAKAMLASSEKAKKASSAVELHPTAKLAEPY